MSDQNPRRILWLAGAIAGVGLLVYVSGDDDAGGPKGAASKKDRSAMVDGRASSVDGRTGRADGTVGAPAPAVAQGPKPGMSTTPLVAGDQRVSAVDRTELSPDAKIRERRARAARASVLGARLERHIEDLKERIAQADGEEKAELERSLEILERNLRYRKHLMGPHGSSVRPGSAAP